MKKILLIHNRYRYQGGEDLAVENELQLLKKDYIVEKHNWLSSIDIKEHSLHIPKKLIFPIKKSEKFDYVKLPNKQNELCEFLYGKSWKTPLTKNSEYRMEIIDNKPKLIKRSFIGSLNRKIKEFFCKKFQKK